ncbi:Glu/Leu/Phe/Val dehydrogenase [Pseudomonadota bacterium]
MEEMFAFADDLGPAKIIHITEPSVGLKAILVVDNVATGPSIGGIRMATDVTTEECVRLARAMTMKNAAAGLPHGGGKAVVIADPKMPLDKKETIIRALANSLRDIKEYILAPDMGTDEVCMAWIKDEVDRVVGLPRELGGIPLDEIGATGWGLSHVVDEAIQFCDINLDGARVVVQGFGAVGLHAARFLCQKGAILVAVADSVGATHCHEGLDINTLIELKQSGKSVVDYANGEVLARDDVIDVECDIWIPAARPDVIHEDNVHRLKTKLVVQGANIPFTHGAEQYLHENGVLCVPDFIANAGGVICAAMEYQGANESSALAAIAEKVGRNTRLVLQRSKEENVLPRNAAVALAEQRVRKAMSFRRWAII